MPMRAAHLLGRKGAKLVAVQYASKCLKSAVRLLQGVVTEDERTTYIGAAQLGDCIGYEIAGRFEDGTEVATTRYEKGLVEGGVFMAGVKKGTKKGATVGPVKKDTRTGETEGGGKKK